MKKAALLFLAAGILLTAPCATRAAAPSYLPVQGVLTDAEGDPVSGATSFTFSIYDNEAGGEALWTETLSALVEEGVFTVYLGEVESIDMAMFRDYSDLWLGVQVAGDEEMPRVYLGSTPFSGYAEYCGNVPGHAHSYADITGTVPDTALPAATAVGPQSCEGTDVVVGIDISGALVCAGGGGNEYLAGSGLALTGNTFSVDPTAVQSRVTGACMAGSSIRAINEAGTVACEPDDDLLAALGCGADEIARWTGAVWACTDTWIRGSGEGGYLSKFTDTHAIADSVAFEVDGKIGIGTTDPQATLDVRGSIRAGNDTGDCTAEKAGTIRWTGTTFEGCDGTDWRELGTFGGGGTSYSVLTAEMSGGAVLPVGTIPAVAGRRVHIVKLGICGDSDATSGPNVFTAAGAGLSFTWECGQSTRGSTHILAPTPNLGGNARGFSYADVNYLGNIGEPVDVTWTYHADWDGNLCQTTDSEGNSYSDVAGTVRPWVLYEYQ
ncbi:MAG: hypothetical protein ABIJ56_21110 [Pseudomonadota bacterium]